MTKTQIIHDTVEYYRIHPRGLQDDGDGRNCVYRNPVTHAMCAVGRCIDFNKVSVSTLDAMNNEYWTVTKLAEHVRKILGRKAGLDEILYPQYIGHSTLPLVGSGFWGDLQSFHDAPSNWTPNEHGGNDLTPKGDIALQVLLNRYKDPE